MKKLENYQILISTHTLTWSVTTDFDGGSRSYGYFNSHAHVERDDVDNYVRKLIDNFNSHAHVERDTHFTTLPLYYTNFNSHAHVERDKYSNKTSN